MAKERERESVYVCSQKKKMVAVKNNVEFKAMINMTSYAHQCEFDQKRRINPFFVIYGERKSLLIYRP